jgi:HAD superfamily hydrolase (TIGR01490 family)
LARSIAFFDFDGTITRKDTMLEFIRFSKGDTAYYAGMLLLSPWLLAMKAALVSNAAAKERMLTYFFGGVPLQDFQFSCTAFIEERLPSLLRPDAMAAISAHQDKGDEVVVVSASAENWVAGWCQANDIKCIATRLQVVNDKITGKLNGPNCNGLEKVNRIKANYDPANYESVYCYGDTSGDKPMLSIATHAFYRHFKG